MTGSGFGSFGCAFCGDDQNRWFGHLTQRGASEERRTILLECPRCGTLYETTASGEDRTRRLTRQQADRLFPTRM